MFLAIRIFEVVVLGDLRGVSVEKGIEQDIAGYVDEGLKAFPLDGCYRLDVTQSAHAQSSASWGCDGLDWPRNVIESFAKAQACASFAGSVAKPLVGSTFSTEKIFDKLPRFMEIGRYKNDFGAVQTSE